MAKPLSTENLETLQQELSLVNLSLGELQQRSALYVQRATPDTVVTALNQLRVERILLEVKLQALTDFLQG